MKVSDFIVNYLSTKTDKVFGGQGGSIIHIADSIDRSKKIKFIPGQNEQASSIAADAYHRVSGKLGVCIATSGPGVLNLLQGMACSYFDSIPSLYISGAPITKQIRKNKKIRQIGFQEMEVVDLVKPLTKYAVLIKKPEDIKYELDKALNIAYSGRKGPVLLDIPDDIQRADINTKKLRKYKSKKRKIFNNSKNKTKIILKELEKSERPLLVIGNGVKLSMAENLIKKIVKKNQIPFVTTWATVDIFKHNHKLNAGTFGVAATRYGNFAIQNSDLLVFLGARLSPQIVGSNIDIFSPKSKKIIVDIDKYEFKNHRLKKNIIKINSNVHDLIKGLSHNKITLKKNKIFEWINKIKSYKNRFPVLPDQRILKKNQFLDPYHFFNSLSKTTKKNDILIPDASANLIWFMQSYKNNFLGQKIFTALNHSPMGYSMPASVGAYFGKQTSRVLAFIGDGSMQMNIQELETIKHYNINTKIFILNNNGYGLIKQTQETWLKSNYVGVDKKSGLSLPNFIDVAKAYKIKTTQIKSNKNLVKRLKNILKQKGPVIVELMIDPKARVNPKIEFGRPLHDMSPKLDKNILKSIII